MNHIEEQIWNYIDGTGTPEELQAIAELIEKDATYRNKYQELLLFNVELRNIEIDEPPMAFTYNVMEAIRNEHAQQPLKATINKNIINVVAGFFIITIAALVIYSLTTVNWSASHSSNTMDSIINFSSLKKYMTAPVLKIFLFFDVLMALALFDGYLRRKNYPKQA